MYIYICICLYIYVYIYIYIFYVVFFSESATVHVYIYAQPPCGEPCTDSTGYKMFLSVSDSEREKPLCGPPLAEPTLSV